MHTFRTLFAGLFLVSLAGAEDVTIYRPLDPAAPAPSAAPTPATAPAPAKPAETHAYTVQKGDSLWKIAREQKVSVSSLKSANNLASDTVRVGAILKIPGGTPAPEVRRAEPVAAPAPTTSASASSDAAPAPKTAPAVPVAVASGHLPVSVQVDLQKKFMEETKALARQGVRYDGNWHPPGADETWDMDCSNTSRWLYQKVAGISLSRTASDQYYDLQQKDRAWEAPRDAKGEVDTAALFSKLEVGDLLFWENTYKPRRDPPVTHVMVFLGKNSRGQWLMAGSQSGGGFCNVSGSGPDVYVFDPQRLVGGYYKNFGFGHVRGRFVAYGRPMLDKLQDGGLQVATSQ